MKKGDILVSGKAEILNDDGEVAEYIYPGADADIIAEVNFYYEDEINISYQDKIKTGRAKKDYGIRFFDYHLKNPFFRQDYEQFDLTEHASQRILPTISIFRFILKPICMKNVRQRKKRIVKQRQQQLHRAVLSNILQI